MLTSQEVGTIAVIHRGRGLSGAASTSRGTVERGSRRAGPSARERMTGVGATLLAKGVSAGHGQRELFSGLDLVVAPGDVVGLVGPNGAGK